MEGKFLTAEGRLNRKPYILRGWFLTCHPQTFGHRSIYICGEAATTTLNPELLSPLPFTRFPLISPLVKDESCII